MKKITPIIIGVKPSKLLVGKILNISKEIKTT